MRFHGSHPSRRTAASYRLASACNPKKVTVPNRRLGRGSVQEWPLSLNDTLIDDSSESRIFPGMRAAHAQWDEIDRCGARQRPLPDGEKFGGEVLFRATPHRPVAHSRGSQD